MAVRSLITIEEACELLGVSRPTFAKIREERRLQTFWVGKRPRFVREEVEAIANPTPEVASGAPEDPRVSFHTLSEVSVNDLEVEPDIFDLRRLRKFDPYGVLTLFCAIVGRANHGQEVTLLVEDNFTCNYLRTLGLFLEFERLHPHLIKWDRSIMKSEYSDLSYPIPLTNIRLKRQEEPAIVKLKELLRGQGFSKNIGDYIGWILGELVDNSITYSLQHGLSSSCYILAQRFRIASTESECIIVGVADMGPGIPASLKRNPKHSALSDERAFLMAFKPRVSSWADEYKRGKGLTDVLGIAMGNQSVFRAESNDLSFRADFRAPSHEFRHLPVGVGGTRFVLCLIDHDFQSKKRDEIAAFIDKVLGEI